METIEATYRVATPLFLGGAEPEKTAELRLPSFKGALRFWWRASVWPGFARSGGSVKDLRRREAELFGSSDEHVGQSRISLRLRVDSAAPQPIRKGAQLTDGSGKVGPGARYLGYGVMEAFASGKRGTQAGQLIRPGLPAFSFRVGIVAKNDLSAQRAELLLALKLLGQVGSLGSKARRGYGSLTLVRLAVAGQETWQPPETPDELSTRLKALVGESLGQPASSSSSPAIDEYPPLTALSAKTRIVIVPPSETDTTPLKLLDRLGREMVRYRSWGRGGKILGDIPSEKNFEPDHDLMKKPPPARSSHPQRIVFGLPHNYGKTSDVQVKPWHKELDRRASPLFLHIHQVSDEKRPIGVLCFLPAVFLPEGKSAISVGGTQVPLNVGSLWQPIERFLDRFAKGGAKEPFGSVLEVPLV